MNWINIKDRLPPRDRNILIYDDLNWVFVGNHERNYFQVEIPSATAIYTKLDEKRLLTNFIHLYKRALNPILFRPITVDYCEGTATHWMELPESPYIAPDIWKHRKDYINESSPDDVLMYHENLGVIEGYYLNHSDTYSCKVYWKEEDINYWMPLPEPPKK